MEKEKIRMKILKITLLFVIVLLLLAGCQSNKPQNANPDMPEGVVNITWQWTELIQQSAPASQSVVPDPQNYTIQFKDDGKVAIKADCNTVSGTFEWDKQGLKINLGPSTRAACGEQSLDQQYLDLLSQVVTGGLDGGKFYLETAGGEKRMGFTKGG